MEQPTQNETLASDWGWIRKALRSAAQAFTEQLLLISSGTITARPDTQVPGLEWDVRELAAHVVGLPAMYRSLNENDQPMEQPDDFTTFSKSARAHLDHCTLEELAEMLTSETDSLLAALGGDGRAPWMLYLETSVAKVGAGFLGELVLHGQDLAPLTGAKVNIEARLAHAWIAASMTLAPFFIDRQAAQRSPGVYHLKFRGGKEYTMRIENGQLSTDEGRRGRPDAHMVADPVTYMLVTMGRKSQVMAGLSGKIMVYGRRPWKFMQLANLTVDGI